MIKAKDIKDISHELVNKMNDEKSRLAYRKFLESSSKSSFKEIGSEKIDDSTTLHDNNNKTFKSRLFIFFANCFDK